MAPPIVDWHQRFNFGGPRPVSNIRVIYIHTTENDFGTPAENVANYQINSQSGSYHTLVDSEKLLIENTPDWITWSTGNSGNDHGLHISFVRWARATRQQWLDQPRMLEMGAWQVAQWVKQFGIPVRFINGSQLKAGKWGISTHNEARALGGTDHTDPGQGFPMDHFLGLVNNELSGGGAPPTSANNKPKGFDVSDSENISEILRQLGGRREGDRVVWPGWDQLDGHTVVDALGVIAHGLGLSGYGKGKRPVDKSFILHKAAGVVVDRLRREGYADEVAEKAAEKTAERLASQVVADRVADQVVERLAGRSGEVK